MSHSDPVMRRIHACVLAQVPCLLWGDPGTGKTERVFAYAAGVNRHIERWLLSRCEAIDLKPRSLGESGPIVHEAPEYRRAREKGGLVFLDELNRSERPVEGASLDTVDSAAKVGIAIVAACNPPSPGQSCRSLDSATSNRFCHLYVDPDPEMWANAQVAGWATGNGAFPALDAAAHTTAMGASSALFSAFIRRRATLLQAQPKNAVEAGKAWPSTRSWDAAKRLYAVARSLSYSVEDTHSLVAGCVGEGAATEFLAFVTDADLPDPEVLLANPTAYHPTIGRVDRTIAAVTAVAGAITRNCTPQRWTQAWSIVRVCSEADQAAAAIVLVTLLVGTYRGLSGKPEQGKLTAPSKLMPPRIDAVLKQVSS